METELETEYYVLTADIHDGLPCTVLLSLGLRLFPGELAFNHTSRLDTHNRQRHSFWSPVTCMGSERLIFFDLWRQDPQLHWYAIGFNTTRSAAMYFFANSLD